MKKLTVLAGAALMATCFATAAMAVPTTVSFNSPTGDTGLQTKTYGLVTLSAYYVGKGDWHNNGGITYNTNSTTLWGRNNAPNDVGVGICNSGDRPGNGCVSNGDNNEIDDNGNAIDIMRITLAAGYKFVNMGLSSLDGPDTFRLYASNTANPDLTLLSAYATGTQTAGNHTTTLGINPTIDLASVSGFKYLYLMGGSTGLNGDDFLLKSITVDTTGGPGGQEVPEPASLALLGAGLLGLGLAQRRRSKV